jgi:hypothetical protein
MGGVRLTTGLYDENFFNNPARVTANPESKFTLLQVTPVEYTAATGKALSSISNGDDALNTVSGSAGKNLHGRFQLIFPAFYLASNENRKFALAIGFIASVQTDAIIRQSYQTSLAGIADIGPAITFGHKFLEDDALSVGITGHLTYRVAAAPNYSILDYVRGVPLTASNLAGEGSMYDFDFGSTYKFAQWGEFELNAGGAIQNILGGDYSNLSIKPLKLNNSPPRQPRSYGLGVSSYRKTWGNFNNTYFAFEFTDVLNNMNGSIFKLAHLGAETHWKSIALRLGLNQGYWTAGLGLDVHYVSLDLASYGEEMGLNAGSIEDRRYTFNLGLHI